jgi:hypothetical protein
MGVRSPSSAGSWEAIGRSFPKSPSGDVGVDALGFQGVLAVEAGQRAVLIPEHERLTTLGEKGHGERLGHLVLDDAAEVAAGETA